MRVITPDMRDVEIPAHVLADLLKSRQGRLSLLGAEGDRGLGHDTALAGRAARVGAEEASVGDVVAVVHRAAGVAV